jgi:uncharacterized repeat protein (TIGR01451 family)
MGCVRRLGRDKATGNRALRASVLTALAVLGMLATASVASAASFTVNEAADAPLQSSTSTTCASTDGGTCTLRAAVQAADNVGGASTITLSAATYELTLSNPATSEPDNPAVGDLDVNSGVTLTVNGAGAGTSIIDANQIDRAFAVQSGGSLSISGVTVENGAQSDSVPSDYSVAPAYGGAFYNDGSLSITASALVGNSADFGGGVVYADTGASATSITNSIVSNNTTDDEGGVLFATSGSVTFTGDTIAHTSADGLGGVLYDDESGNTVGTVTISGSSITNNLGNYGGGALYLLDAGALNVSSSALNDNTTEYYGGAIYDASSGAISVTGSDLSGDSVSYSYPGGAIYAETTGMLTVTGSTFDDDTAGGEEGGAIYTGGTDLAVTGSTFTGDEASGGGAVYVDGSSSTATESITTSTFSDDTATEYQGGAVWDAAGDLSISGSAFTDNNATFNGGALFYGTGTTTGADGLSLTNDTFDGNQANYGGGIYFNGPATAGTISFLNDTIAHNSAYDGGGIFAPADVNSIENTIVADNTGGSTTDGGGDCYDSSTTDNAGAADMGGNIDSDGSCFSASTANDKIGVDPDLGGLGSNGGPTQTDALLTGSPAIGDGVSGSCPAADQRGVPRPAACDSGAYQTAGADLGIAVTAPATGKVGSPLAYTLKVTNNGPSSATGVTVTDALPAGSTYYSSGASQGSCSGTTSVTCSLGSIDSSNTGTTTTATVTIVVIPGSAGTNTDTGVVSSATSDPSAANNVATGSTAVSGNTTTVTTTTTTTTTVRVPVLSKPVVLTGVASQITTSKVSLSAIINPAGQSTSYAIQYGTSKKYGKTAKGKTLAAGSNPDGVVISVKGLKAGTTYHFRIVAANATGTSYGQDVTFKTKKAATKKATKKKTVKKTKKKAKKQ